MPRPCPLKVWPASTRSLKHDQPALGLPVKPSAHALSLFSAAYSAKKGLFPVLSTTIMPVVLSVAFLVLVAESVGSLTWQEVVLQMS